MIKLRNVATIITRQPVRFFVNDKFFKERDQAAERVYISRQQKEQMKKLLEKLSEEKKQDLSKDSEFQRRLEDILRRYKINNDSFTAEIINLHKNN